jgi:hypothetical protein
MMTEPDTDVRHLLNAQTGKIEWPELQRHFARGLLVRVASDLDLIEVAASMVKDDQGAIESLTQAGKIARASDEDARGWEANRPLFWSVVVPPWVLVQVIKNSAEPQ